MTSNLSTRYLGMDLDSPIVVGACPLTIKPEFVRQLSTCGAGAVVMPSLFQEQIEDVTKTGQADCQNDTCAGQEHYNGGPERYLNSLKEIKAQCNMPIIASLNGSSLGAWLEFSKELEANGADAVELNFQTIQFDFSATAEQIELDLCEMVRTVCCSLKIPVAVKLSPHFTSICAIADRMKNSGANGVVLYAHQPTWDVCIDSRKWTTRWELTPTGTIGQTLQGIYQVRRGMDAISIAASGGVGTSEDAIKTFIAGAEVAMVTSELYRSGADSIRTIVDGISRYVESSPFETIAELHRSRTATDIRPQHTIRSEYLEPLTKLEGYSDPTPSPSRRSGDRFGHAN